jgi:3-oxoadipate enol-lactonase
MTGTHWVDLDGLRFHCRLDGPEGAPWLVFSNSLATDLSVWDDQVAALAADHRILRYDQRGHGRTSVPATPPTIAQMGDDLLALMDRFGVDRATLIGLSMGCPTALRVIERAPERVVRLVLTDGQAATAPTGAAMWEGRIASARAIGMAATADEILGRWFAPGFADTPAGARMRAMIAAIPLEGYVAGARALQGYDFAHVLPRIAVPALLIAGQNDGAMPQSMRALADRIAGAAFHVIPGAGHIPPVEQAQAYTRILVDFLRSSA